MVPFEVTGPNALVKIYDRMTSSFEFVMAVRKGKKIIKKIFPNKEKMLSLIRSPKPEEKEAHTSPYCMYIKKIVGY